jgi:hypothetical protein
MGQRILRETTGIFQKQFPLDEKFTQVSAMIEHRLVERLH